jgi:anti-anti-sigma regulatory factor
MEFSPEHWPAPLPFAATALAIDLSEPRFMGASTLGTIVRARKLLRRRSGSL